MNGTNFLSHSWWLNYTGPRKIKLDIAKIIKVPSATASIQATQDLNSAQLDPQWDNWAVANEHRKLLYTCIYLAVSLEQSNKFVAPFSCNYLVYWGHIVLKSQYCEIQLQSLHKKRIFLQDLPLASSWHFSEITEKTNLANITDGIFLGGKPITPFCS